MWSIPTIGGLVLVYFLSRTIYRLYFSPLSKFPGPKIAVRGGQYVWVIEEMHRKYGPIVRTMPNVLHVNDPSFIDQLYSQSPNLRRERAQTVLNLFHQHMSVLPTRDHSLHRRRRAVLSRFFSQQNVRRLVPVINDTLADLLHRMEGWAKIGEPVSVNAPYRAATKDVIQAYALGEGHKCLHMDDCNAAFFETLSTGRFSHVGVHFHWFSVLVTKLPPAFITAISPYLLAFIRFLEDLTVRIEEIRGAKDHPEGTTIFHEILRSDIPESEKSTPRLVDEAMVLAIAGADTTAATMVALTYHVLNDRNIFARLREELSSAMPSADQPPDPVKLDALPFMNALIEEALRLYPSGTHRQDRVAPDEDLVFQYPNGETLSVPAGTMIGMTAPLINRHPAWYENPDVFYPDRYLENPKLFKRHLTFSKGARQCLGMNLAYQELQTFTAGIFRKYEPYDGTLKQQNGPTLELYETSMRDIKLHADYVTPGLAPGSQGVRVRIRHV
ncbi:hypothetical protein FZEAL_337 [Fusarium zealandicum]|uniref:Cytochrome P450 n=1 Tax=Fusarium zealandicum TaxID=1053134 RepID=A0A8H4UUV3_9HYPO|nr:hypothetical protein FZEAL_337 [Fusarium zealandicum]